MRPLRDDALRIWQAGLEAVRSERLVRNAMGVEGRRLRLGDQWIPLDSIGRITVVGAGKAGAGMAAGVLEALPPWVLDEKRVAGWINVPEDCVRPMARIHLHPARPPGVNEPTAAGAAGAREILRLVESLGPDDLCLCLLSGGGSALMPAPAEGITLDDKLAVTRHLSAAGANIEQLNTVRKQLSRIKGGGLMRACRTGRLVSLIISDVLGDPLDVIASGPTVEDSSTPQAALAILGQFHARAAGIPDRVFDHLQRKQAVRPAQAVCRVTNLVIGNNATALDAAGQEAVRLGYSPAVHGATQSEGRAEEVGTHLAETALRMRAGPGPDCLISGGEPVVELCDHARRGLGGRNQQLVLAALAHLVSRQSSIDGFGCHWRPASAVDEHGQDARGTRLSKIDETLARNAAAGLVLLSGGTDGEDGPTDAAGAVLDAAMPAAAGQRGLDPADYLARNDAYHFFEPLGGLIKTGPTHTNVCDVRVVVVGRVEADR